MTYANISRIFLRFSCILSRFVLIFDIPSNFFRQSLKSQINALYSGMYKIKSTSSEMLFIVSLNG